MFFCFLSFCFTLAFDSFILRFIRACVTHKTQYFYLYFDQVGSGEVFSIEDPTLLEDDEEEEEVISKDSIDDVIEDDEDDLWRDLDEEEEMRVFKENRRANGRYTSNSASNLAMKVKLGFS